MPVICGLVLLNGHVIPDTAVLYQCTLLLGSSVSMIIRKVPKRSESEGGRERERETERERERES